VTDTRDRIVGASSELFRRQGYTGTGLKQIVAAAAAPFGSIYHFFPGGKQELGAEVIRTSGGMYGQLVGAFFDGEPNPATAIRNAFTGAAATLAETDFADACPIATVALEVSSASEPLREACAEVFESWISGLVPYFSAAGIADEKARELAVGTIAALEGAFVLGRAMRTTAPVLVAGEQMASLVEAALITR
jgi:AcrR family transcriptional regulator